MTDNIPTTNLQEEKKNVDGSTTTCPTIEHKILTSTAMDNSQVKKYLKEDTNSDDVITKISNPQLQYSRDDEDEEEKNNTEAQGDFYSTIENIDQLKEETKKLYAKYTTQAAKIKNLEFDLEMEQGHVNILRSDNQTLRRMAVDMTAITEQEEEYISNKLLKHITGLKKEKGELLIQVEQEEEYLTNMLQKKLVQLQKEKIDLENALEQEQEYMVNRLQKQLELLLRQQQYTSPRAVAVSDPFSSYTSSLPVSPAITGIGSSPSLGATKKWTTTSTTPQYDSMPPAPGLVDVLKAEVNSLRQRAAEMEKEYFQKQQQCNKYKNELIQYRKENNLPLDDITAIDDGRLPRVFRSSTIPPPSSPSSERPQSHRSTSNSSTRSTTIPPLNLDLSQSTSSSSTTSPHSSVLPQTIPTSNTNSTGTYFTSRSSPSVSSSSSSSFQRKTSVEISSSSARRISGNLFGLNYTPPQHPPQL